MMLYSHEMDPIAFGKSQRLNEVTGGKTLEVKPWKVLVEKYLKVGVMDNPHLLNGWFI